MSPVLSFAGVTAGYGAVAVLDRLGCEVRAGEVLALLGANGSGKSTVLKTAMGLTRVTGGSVTFAGAPITAMPTHQRVAAGLGYVPQRRNVFAELSVADNLRMGAFLDPACLKRGIGRVLELFPPLALRQRAPAGALSGGERRMLSIAMTLLPEPQLLLLDEPSSDLSPAMVQAVFAAIARIRRETGVPILLVEQNVAQALQAADRVVVLVRGAVAAAMSPAEAATADLHELFIDGGVRHDGRRPVQP